MALATSTTIYRDAGKPDQAVPVANSCALPGAASTGEVVTSPSPIPISTIDDERSQLEIIWPEFWPALHNREIWQAGPDGTYAWRNQADGTYE